MRFFAEALGASKRSPLRDGTWQLTELRRIRADRDELVPADPDGLPATVLGAMDAPSLPRLYEEEWSSGAPCRAFPLRAFSEPDAPRVKAWRKHAREGTLPPVLLWFVHGLETTIILDGHDRLHASIAEGVAPPTLVLWQVFERSGPQPWRDDVVRAYETTFDRNDITDETRRNLNEALVKAFRESWRASITTARSDPHLDDVWNQEVSAQLASEDPEAAEWMVSSDF